MAGNRIVSPEKNREYVHRWRDKNPDWWFLLRVKVLTHYGNGKCACVKCGESRMACLSIDHILGGGNRHRKVYKNTQSLYRLLLSEKPKGYQTLCMNCQWVKRREEGEDIKWRQSPYLTK